MITFHLEKLRKGLEFHISNYEKIFSVGYFNSKMSQTSVNSFWNLCNFKFLVQDPTYCRNRPSCLALFSLKIRNLFSEDKF